MKKLYFTFAALLIGSAAYSQCSVVVTNSSNVTCNGSNDGSVSVASVGVPTYTYLWMPGGQTVQNPNNLAPATYTVTMTDANSCQAIATVTITQPQPITSTLTHTAVTCDSACNGSAMATPAGGTAPYTYLWSNSATTQNISNLCAAMYSVTITDLNGCTKADSVLITQPAPLVVSASATDASCVSCSDGSASAIVSGGTPTYSYAWAPDGQTTATITGLAPGSYTVCVTDVHGCSSCDTIQVNAATGFTSLDDKYWIDVYPNPTSGSIHLLTSSPETNNVRVTLRDVTGKIIFSELYYDVKGVEKTFDLENQSAGFYFMEIEIGNSHMAQKIIKY